MGNRLAKLKAEQNIRVRVISVLNGIMNDMAYQPKLCAKQVVRNYYNAEQEAHKQTNQEIKKIVEKGRND